MAEAPTRYAWYDSPVGRLLLAGDAGRAHLDQLSERQPHASPGAGLAAR